MNNKEMYENSFEYDKVNDGIDKYNNEGKNTYYMTCDGKKVATMEEVMQYNKRFYEKIKEPQYTEKEIMISSGVTLQMQF